MQSRSPVPRTYRSLQIHNVTLTFPRIPPGPFNCATALVWPSPADYANDSSSYLPYVLHPFNIEGSKENREGKKGIKWRGKTAVH